MPRPPRPVTDGLLYHALNRGNNRAAVLAAAEDYLVFLKALGQTRQRYPFRLFGYCLMTNHFHLLLAPEPGQSISRIPKSLTVAHAALLPEAGGLPGRLCRRGQEQPARWRHWFSA
jgi:putative transposase